MASSYECGSCKFATAWMPRADAEAFQRKHRRTAHAGHVPRDEKIVSSAERVDPMMAGLVVAAVLVLVVIKWIHDAVT